MNKFEKCRTCVNNGGAYGSSFCTICERADMYKEDLVRKYCSEDVAITAKLTRTDYTKYSAKTTLPITNVIFAPPATIVFWNDGSKTVVKCDNEAYDPEKGLAMAIAKRALGNKGNYYETFKKWVDPYVEKQKEAEAPVEEEKPWYVWHLFQQKADIICEYKHKCHAVRKANYLNRAGNKGRYVASKTKPHYGD